ncbi:MAG: hypothetical protein H0V89_11805 [Deltaproteobacteria bacterium]|nr:hypothetical protein [Deltaproteobacteria bacterium]
MASVAAAARAVIARPGFTADLEDRISSVLAEAGAGTLGDWLAEVKLAEVWTEATAELLARHLRRVVATDAFAAWWSDLHRE